jgi:hypothetical protein
MTLSDWVLSQMQDGNTFYYTTLRYTSGQMVWRPMIYIKCRNKVFSLSNNTKNINACMQDIQKVK